MIAALQISVAGPSQGKTSKKKEKQKDTSGSDLLDTVVVLTSRQRPRLGCLVQGTPSMHRETSSVSRLITASCRKDPVDGIPLQLLAVPRARELMFTRRTAAAKPGSMCWSCSSDTVQRPTSKSDLWEPPLLELRATGLWALEKLIAFARMET